MKRTLVTVVCLTFATAMFVGATAMEPKDAPIRAIEDAFAAAWNAHDARTMAAFFAKDGDLINPSGRAAKGRDEIEQLIREEHATVFKQSIYKPGLQSVRFIEPEIAFVESDTEISGVTKPDGTTAAIKVHIIRLMQKKDGKWWTVAARPVIYPPPPAPK